MKIAFKIKKNIAGFTLVELLVVVAIIGLVLAISVFGLQGARENSRDAKRKADLETIRGGLEMFKADCNQYPPAPLPSPGQQLKGLGSPYPSSCATSNIYIENIPSDPVAGNNYSYSPAGTPRSTYTLCSTIENSTATPPAGCASCGGTCRYKIINP